MIRSFVFNNGKIVGQDLDIDSLKLVMFDKGLHVWIDFEHVTADEARPILEGVCNFHPLAIEDCVQPSDRPKVDEYENYLFMVIHAVDFTRATEEFRTTELNIFMGKDFLVTYHDDPLRSITAAMDRVQKNSLAVAKAPDRLAHTILDLLIENYRPVMSELSAEIEDLEQKVLSRKPKNIPSEVLKVKNEVQQLRQIIAPQREVIARFARGEFSLVRAHLVPYYRDLYDHLMRISDAIETYRDSLTSVLQVHLNLQQSEVNKVIKVLTVMATLAMPIFLITSFYGMNFGHYPREMSDPLTAYAWVFGLTAVTTGVLYLFLKRKGWF
ncbi:MAG: magnesium/cobalt transporter CorA [Verrucomicrobia bacterium]|nr:magnesium/cobalt transporter CorA [Verrucomicrobiota bacterium]